MRTPLRLLAGIFGLITIVTIVIAFAGGSWTTVLVCAGLWLGLGFLSAVVPSSTSSQLGMAATSEQYGGASTDSVRSLIGKGANVNALGVNGRPIHEAAVWGRVDVIEELLRHGADPNGRNQDGWTALHVAANNDNGELIDLLIASGSDVAATTKSGETALHIATARLGLNAAERLLEQGADPNATNAQGTTALQEVVRSAEIFGQPMVLNGTTVQNDDAIRECHDLAALLRQHGAR